LEVGPIQDPSFYRVTGFWLGDWIVFINFFSFKSKQRCLKKKIQRVTIKFLFESPGQPAGLNFKSMILILPDHQPLLFLVISPLLFLVLSSNCTSELITLQVMLKLAYTQATMTFIWDFFKKDFSFEILMRNLIESINMIC
jgi:hypothetical protein